MGRNAKPKVRLDRKRKYAVSSSNSCDKIDRLAVRRDRKVLDLLVKASCKLDRLS